MTSLPRANRVLRVATVILIVAGIALHLWLGSRAGLVLIGVGVAAHVAAALLGRGWWLRRQRDQQT